MTIAFIMSAVEDINTVTGLGQHQLNIVKGLMRLSLEDNYVFLVNDVVRDQLLEIYPRIRTYSYGKQHKLPKIFEKYYYVLNMFCLNWFYVPKAIKNIDPDVIFQPYNCITIRTRWKKPYALMVLDMYHRFFPGCMRKNKYKLTVSRHDSMMEDSDLIITSSQVNKEHIGLFYPEAVSKVKIIPVPIDIDVDDCEYFETRKPYILCVNSMRYHKNIHTLVKAFNLIKDRIEHNLVLIGTNENDEADNIKSENDRVIFTGYISSAQRNYLYREADLFVSSTMFEGFGMTPLEAMVFKRKVLVSDIPVMRESTLGCAEYFGDIENEDYLAERIMEQLEKEYTEDYLEEIRRLVERKYSPKKIAQQIHDSLTELGNDNEDSN